MSDVEVVNDLLILEELDFTPPCVSEKPEQHPAEFIIRCRFCGDHGFICSTHLEIGRRAIEAALWPGRMIHMACCDTRVASFDEGVSVTPLKPGV